ncbi:MAG: imidazole glycerol phosphate synthase subunit HisH [Nitrospirota bacterium]
MIAIIDYGVGNLRSVQKAFEKVGHNAIVTSNPKEIENAKAVVLPGVGAFAKCIGNLNEYGLVDVIYKTIKAGKPFLGICLGMQLLFTEGEEFGIHKGLDIIKGRVVRFPATSSNNGPLKVPHMGWNNLIIKKDAPILSDIRNNPFVYFVHSYYCVPEDSSVMAAVTDYGLQFTSTIWKENIYATQFHPEKSQEIGLKILKRFGELS